MRVVGAYNPILVTRGGRLPPFAVWAVGCPGGASCWWRVVACAGGRVRVVTRIGGDKCPKPGESKIDTTGAGAGCAPGRGGGFGSGCAWWLGSWWGQ